MPAEQGEYIMKVVFVFLLPCFAMASASVGVCPESFGSPDTKKSQAQETPSEPTHEQRVIALESEAQRLGKKSQELGNAPVVIPQERFQNLETQFKSLTYSPSQEQRIAELEKIAQRTNHVQQLQERLELPLREADEIADGTGPLSFENVRESQELFEKGDHVSAYWKISPKRFYRWMVRGYQKPGDLHRKFQELNEMLEKNGFSQQQTQEVIQSLKEFETVFPLEYAVPELSQAGFTNEQIVKIIKLDVIRRGYKYISSGTTYAGPFSDFFVRKTSAKEKMERLRKAGFTEEEINRIPVGILKRTVTDDIVDTAVMSYAVGGVALAVDGVIWLFTDNSFIW